jgi:CBS-domain-containing membrane protein
LVHISRSAHFRPEQNTRLSRASRWRAPSIHFLPEFLFADAAPENEISATRIENTLSSMNSDKRHVLSASWTRLANDVELAFFRIERENRFLSAAINGGIAGAAVALIAWLVSNMHEGDLLLFACLGSSAASIVFAPLAKNNSLRSIIGAYMIAAAGCFLLFPLENHKVLALPLLSFLAVFVPIMLMRLADCMHPAAIGSALAFVIYERDIKSLLMLLLAIVILLTVVKIFVYVYLEDLVFRDFWKEFRREYYGKELTVTIVEPPRTDEKTARPN